MAATSARNIGCRSIDGEYLLAGTTRPSASAMARTWCGPGAAADAYVVHAELAGLRGELRHLEPRAGEGVERDGEGPLTVRRPQGLHGRGGRIRPVRHRLDGDGAVHGLPDVRDERQHGQRPAVTVQADHLRALGGQDPARLRVPVAVAGLVRLRRRQRDHRGQPQVADDLHRDQRLAEVVVGLGDDEVDALLDRPAELLGIHGPNGPGGRRVVRIISPGVADVPGHQRTALGRDLAGYPHGGAVHRLQVALAAHVTQLLPVRVVGQRHHHVRARAQELAVQLAHRVRVTMLRPI